MRPDREATIHEMAPGIFKSKTVLYIGARHDAYSYGDHFHKGGAKVTVIEAFPGNIPYLEQDSRISEVILGDIREWEPEDRKWDAIFWWHGPEHIKEEEIPPVLNKIEKCCNNIVLLGCPWGDHEQGAMYGNDFETHQSSNDKIFENLGYTCKYLVGKGIYGSHITSVKYIK